MRIRCVDKGIHKALPFIGSLVVCRLNVLITLIATCIVATSKSIHARKRSHDDPSLPQSLHSRAGR